MPRRDSQIAPGLRYFHSRYGFRGVQLVGNLRLESAGSELEVFRLLDWLEDFDATK